MADIRFSNAIPGIVVTVVLHLIVVGSALHLEGVQATVANSPMPVMIALVDSVREQPKSAPPMPQPVKKSAPQPQPLPIPQEISTAAPTEDTVSQPVEELPPPPLPQEVLATVPAQEATPRAVEEPPPPVASVSQPRFDADYLNNPSPVYPMLARRLGEQGRVMLRVRVRADGMPIEVMLDRSSGSSRLDQAALEAVNHWKFIPARQGEMSVEALILIPISFRLES